MNKEKIFENGVEMFKERIEKQKELYAKIVSKAKEESKSKVYYLKDKDLFDEMIKVFEPALDNTQAKGDLFDIYTIALHQKTGSLIIANNGATLYCLTEKSNKPLIIRHIGFVIYTVGLGMEYGNIGIVGNVYDKNVVLRTESACTPSFLFGSQRCNCYHQWQNARELAARFNKIKTPKIKDGANFEKWVQSQFKFKNGKHLPTANSNLGFLLLHIDSQNGMGSGYSANEFVYNLTERASLRHRGEYTSEQLYDATMYGGFTSIGINADPRAENEQIGYKITPVILDFLHVNNNIIMLSNNPCKLKAMKDFGYTITRVKSIGAVNTAGATEALQRGTEFGHFDINNNLVTFKEDFNRVKKEIKSILRR